MDKLSTVLASIIESQGGTVYVPYAALENEDVEGITIIDDPVNQRYIFTTTKGDINE